MIYYIILYYIYIILYIILYVIYYILYIICFGRDLCRKMRRKKLPPEARKQRRALDNLKMISKISKMYFTNLFVAGR